MPAGVAAFMTVAAAAAAAGAFYFLSYSEVLPTDRPGVCLFTPGVRPYPVTNSVCARPTWLGTAVLRRTNIVVVVGALSSAHAGGISQWCSYVGGHRLAGAHTTPDKRGS